MNRKTKYFFILNKSQTVVFVFYVRAQNASAIVCVYAVYIDRYDLMRS